MDKKLRKRVRLRRSGQLAGTTKGAMTETNYYQKLSAYLAENKKKTALEAEIQNMAAQAIDTNTKTNYNKKLAAYGEKKKKKTPQEAEIKNMAAKAIDTNTKNNAAKASPE